MPTKEINGVDYHYEMRGEGRPLLLLHGFTGAVDNWAPFAEKWGINFRSLAVDILGHGHSAAPADPQRYRMDLVAADIITLLDHLEFTGTHLVGYSMGGRLALYLALNYADRFDRIVIESSSPGLPTDSEREARRNQDNMLAERIERDGVPAFVDFWEGLALWESQRSLSAAILEKQREQRLRNRPVGLANSLRGMGTGAQPSLWERLRELDRPVLLINGELDNKYVAINQQMLPLIRQGKMGTIPDVGHNTHLEAPRVFANMVKQFLRFQFEY